MTPDMIMKDTPVLQVEELCVRDTLVSFFMGCKFQLYKANIKVNAHFPVESMRVIKVDHPTYGEFCLVESQDDYRECLMPRNFNLILALHVSLASHSWSDETKQKLVENKTNYGIIEDHLSANLLESLFYALSKYKHYLSDDGKAVAFEPSLECWTTMKLGGKDGKDMKIERRTTLTLKPTHKRSEDGSLPFLAYVDLDKTERKLNTSLTYTRHDINP